MKLSEAIRLGAMLKPQAFGQAFDGTGTCAAAAALDAIGLLDRRDADGGDFIGAATCFGWPLWQVQEAKCPACHSSAFARAKTIPHLNDEHRWTREQIADFVETIEQQQAVEAERHPALTMSTGDVRGTETVGVGCRAARA